MKKFRVYIALFFLETLITNSIAIAQVPGYMGKKVVAGYGFYFNPGFSNIAMGYSDSPLNTQHEFFLEYTTGKKFMVGASARLYRYTYNNTELVDANGPSNSSTFNQVDQNPSGSYQIKGRNFSLYGKLFKSNYLAPWGRYFIFGLSVIKYETDYDSGDMRVLVKETKYGTVTNSYYTDFGPTTEFYSTADVFFGNGKSRIFSNRIVFDYGYTVGIVSMAHMFLNALDFGETLYPQDYIKSTSASRVAALNRFNFYFKLGYLF